MTNYMGKRAVHALVQEVKELELPANMPRVIDCSYRKFSGYEGLRFVVCDENMNSLFYDVVLIRYASGKIWIHLRCNDEVDALVSDKVVTLDADGKVDYCSGGVAYVG